MRSRRFLVALSAVASTLALTGVHAATAASTPYCGIVWGSLPKSAGDLVPAPIVGARTGQHDCFDRLVIDVSGLPTPGFSVRYTDGLHAPGSGQPLAVSGGAVLTVTVLAPSYDADGHPTVPWTFGGHIARPAYRTFRDVVYGGSFEGESTFGLGVRARLPFRVLTLDGPLGGSRLVIDVAHRW